MNSIGPSSSRSEVSKQDSEPRQVLVEELITKEIVNIYLFIFLLYIINILREIFSDCFIIV